MTTDIYTLRSVLERTHDRMHAMLGAHETDPKMSVGLERLRRKITTTLSAGAVGQIAIQISHAPNLRRDLSTIRESIALTPAHTHAFRARCLHIAVVFVVCARENETVTRIEYLERADRPELIEMLEGEKDFPQHLLYLYRRSSGPAENLIAWQEGPIDGLLTGSFRADFSDNREFSDFNLPPLPQALLTRVHVRRSARGTGSVERW